MTGLPDTLGWKNELEESFLYLYLSSPVFLDLYFSSVPISLSGRIYRMQG